MKIAVIFTGFFRTFHYTKHTFKEFIMDPLNTDVFFSTPKTIFTPPEQENPDWLIRVPYHSANDKLVFPDIIDFFGDKLKAYDLVDYQLEPYKKLCQNNGVPEYNYIGTITYRILSQLNGIALSMKLFKQYVEKNNINYDLVIMTRGDNKYFTPFDLSVLDMTKIGYPDHNRNQKGHNHLPSWCAPSNKFNKAFSDQMLVGSQKNMFVWCDIADMVFDYYREGMYFSTENLMAYHLQKNNIDWYGANYMEHALWRNEEWE